MYIYVVATGGEHTLVVSTETFQTNQLQAGNKADVCANAKKGELVI